MGGGGHKTPPESCDISEFKTDVSTKLYMLLPIMLYRFLPKLTVCGGTLLSAQLDGISRSRKAAISVFEKFGKNFKSFLLLILYFFTFQNVIFGLVYDFTTFILCRTLVFQNPF